MTDSHSLEPTSFWNWGKSADFWRLYSYLTYCRITIAAWVFLTRWHSNKELPLQRCSCVLLPQVGLRPTGCEAPAVPSSFNHTLHAAKSLHKPCAGSGASCHGTASWHQGIKNISDLEGIHWHLFLKYPNTFWWKIPNLSQLYCASSCISSREFACDLHAQPNRDTDGIWIALQLLSEAERNGEQLCCILLCVFSLYRTFLQVPGIHIMGDVHTCVFKERRGWEWECTYPMQENFGSHFLPQCRSVNQWRKNIKVQS